MRKSRRRENAGCVGVPAEAVVFKAGKDLAHFPLIGERVPGHNVFASGIAGRTVDVLNAIETRLVFDRSINFAPPFPRRLWLGVVLEQYFARPCQRLARAFGETGGDSFEYRFLVVAEDGELRDALDNVKALARLRAVAHHVAQADDLTHAKLIDAVQHEIG